MMMKPINMKPIFLSVILSMLLFSAQYSYAHLIHQDEYTQVITKRAQKIVDKLGLEAAKSSVVRAIIVQQYRDLNETQIWHDEQGKTLKTAAASTDELAQLEEEKTKKLAHLHRDYLGALKKQLNNEQIETVKNEMTYNVLPITYKGYVDMLPSLTEVQKKQILTYLTEAREKAMDGGSSKEKHWWFGKYKGKINNYLSKEGVETKEARKEWEEKLKKEERAKKAQS